MADVPWFLIPQQRAAQARAAIDKATAAHAPPVTKHDVFAGGDIANWVTQGAARGTTKKTGGLVTAKPGGAAPDGYAADDGGEGFPIVPVAIGVVAVAGVGFLLLMKKKKRR